MSEYTIYKSTLNDLASTMGMFVKVTDKMLEQGIDQWNYDYPDTQTLKRDIEDQEQFVIRDKGIVIASMVLNTIQDEQYHNVHWRNPNRDVLVIHRLAVHPDYQGRGLAKKMCAFAEEYGKERGLSSIRLDAYAGNLGSNALYQKLGYARANGFCYFRKKAIPFYCWEKGIG